MPLMADLRYALRTLRKRPGSTTLVVTTLAAAIAASTVIYSAIDVVWHLIPAVNRDLVYLPSLVARTIPAEGGTRSVQLRSPVSVPDLADWQARATTIDAFAGFAMESATLTGLAVPLRVSSIGITPNLTELWGITPVLGRPFRTDEGRTGANPVVLLSHAFWVQHFEANGAALGRSLLLDGIAHTVVGVLPLEAGTGVFKSADVYVPLVVDALRGARGERTVFVTGRLRQGATREQASSELEAIAGQLQNEHPETNQRISTAALPLIEGSGFNIRILLSLLGLIALLVILVACANVANIIVAQSIAQRHEIAIRAALGAGRFDRIKHVLIESALASMAAGGIGLLLASWGMAALQWLGSDTLGFAEVQMNVRVVAAGILTAFATPLGFAVLPAWRMPVPEVQELKQGGRTIGHRGTSRMHRAIVAVQAAAAVVVTLQIALLVSATWKLTAIASGFDPAGVLSFRVGLPEARSSQPGAIARFADDLLARMRALPGVESAAIIDRLPVADFESTARLTLEGDAPAPIESRPTVARASIGDDYFSTMRIPVTRGRVFTVTEVASAAGVAVVNEEAARRLFRGRDPVGARLALDATAGREEWLRVVGVVGNLRNSDIDQGTLAQVYVPFARQPSAEIAIVVKSASDDPLTLVPAIRAQVAEIDRNQPIHDVATMSRVLYNDLAETYVLTAMLTAVGFIALVLSSAGIYGIVSYAVIQRRREIGVRMALGALPGHMVRMVLTQGARPVAAGAVLGLIVAIGLALTVAASVPELDARDPITYAAVMLLITAVTVVASYVPARRAATVDPLVTLRAD